MFYFHFENGSIYLDRDGLDLSDVQAARSEAIATIAHILRDGDIDSLWTGKPLRMWVTNKPDGSGTVLFMLNISASGSSQQELRSASAVV